jgi:Glyoxalase-like domain
VARWGTDIPELAELEVADPPRRWEALGFEVSDRQLHLGAVRVTLGVEGRGIARWAVRGIEETTDIDGLPTVPAPLPSQPNPVTHPNGATGIDHIVVVTPDFDRTARALEAAGMPLRRTRQVGTPGDGSAFRQGFRRLGPAILELVEATTAPPAPARFWGLVVIVNDLEALKRRLTDRLGDIKPAVQPGRHIATVRSHAELGQKLAFMDPEP